MTPKTLFTQTAHALRLDACGVCSALLPSQLLQQLERTGPVPFAPTHLPDRLDTEALLPSCGSFFVVLFPYKPEKEETGNIALYARPMDYHKINHQYLDKIITVMKKAYPEESFLPMVDTSPMVDRYLAFQAGLGFFGRNHCLIHPKYGSFFTIGAILTTINMAPNTPLSLSCGNCHICEQRCPGRVISENKFNPWHCKSYLTQKKEDLTEEEIQILRRTPTIFGCDECQIHCPYNQKAPASPLPEIHEHRIATLTEETLASYSNRSFDKTFRSYAFAWRGKKVLLRNLALIAKNND